jgi:hypothetical protein
MAHRDLMAIQIHRHTGHKLFATETLSVRGMAG